MTITTIRSTRRLGMASGAAAALLLLASACGTETAAVAPATIRGPQGSSAETESTADLAECLVQQAKSRHTGTPCQEQTDPAEAEQPLYLAPSGRPVPLPGQGG